MSLSPATLSTADVTAHIQSDGVVEWTSLSRLLGDGTQSCVDGREPGTVVGTPGGDAGEYLLALATIEKLTGSELSAAELPGMLQRFMGHFGRFYMHTDSHAMAHLAKALSGDATFAHLGGDLSATEALVRQPGEHAAALLPYLLEPGHIGCGHLKLIALHPGDYGVRLGLTQAFLTTVFQALWSGADVDYVVLQGGHAEGAVVQVSEGRDQHAFTRVPKVAPCHDGTQIFVQHPHAVTWLRGQAVRFLIEDDARLADVSADDFLGALNALAGVQLGETLGHLAQGLPVYQATVTESGEVTVAG